MKRMLIFDLDGTILDTLKDLYASINRALSLYGLPNRSQKEVRSFVGKGMRKLVECCVLEGENREQVEAVYQAFVADYQKHCAQDTEPYPGILSLLSHSQEHGYRMAVLSNKADVITQKLCEIYFPKYFDFVLGEKIGIPKKPNPAGLNHLLKQANLSPQEILYFGDSETDISLVNNSNIDAVFVDWGFRDRSFLLEQGAKVVVSNPDEILEYLKKKEYS